VRTTSRRAKSEECGKKRPARREEAARGDADSQRWREDRPVRNAENEEGGGKREEGRRKKEERRVTREE